MTTILESGFVRLLDAMGDLDRVADTARTSTDSSGSYEQNKRLAARLHRDRHTSPWEFAVFQFHIRAPIFVARQIMRHRMSSVNERSGRYSELDCDFYHPRRWRAPHPSNRQMSVEVNDIDQDEASTVLKDAYYAAEVAYRRLLELGVAREQARFVLPVATMTEWRWQIDAHNLNHFLSLRLAEDAQEETREVARGIVAELRRAGFGDIADLWGV